MKSRCYLVEQTEKYHKALAWATFRERVVTLGSNLSVLCMDIGTSSIKAGLLDDTGRLNWYMHDTILTNKSALEAWDPAIWVSSIKRILQKFNAENQGSNPLALVLSGNGPTLVPVDSQGRVIGSALLWIDTNRVNRAGNRSFYLPKIAWFRQHHPDSFARATTFLSCPEYLNYLLTGESRTITPSQRFIPYIWGSDDIAAYGIDPALLPDWCKPGEVVGQVTASAAKEFGLKSGLPVIAAGSDFMMSLAGTATIEPGRVCDRAGSSEGINYCTEKEIRDSNLRTLPHLADGCWNVAGILSSTGLMFEWFRWISGQSSRSYQDMLTEIRSLAVGTSLPWFIPDHSEASSWEFHRGMFLNLRPEHGPAHMGRSVVESIGFAVRQAIENLRRAGLPVSEIRLCGGQAKNPIWVAMKADITGVAMLVPQVPDAELVGNAMMGFLGLGHFTSVSQAASAMVKISQRVEPDPVAHAAYTRRYADYQEIQEQVAGKIK